VNAYLKFFSSCFIIVSIIELFMIIIFSMTELNIGKTMSLIDFLFASGLFPLSGIILYCFLIIITCCLLILGIVFRKVISKEINYKILSKYLIVLGLFVLISSFVKLEYIVLLSNKEVIVNAEAVIFEAILYNPVITPFYAAVLWISFSGIACGYLICGLIITAGGIQWSSEIAREKVSESNNLGINK